MTREEIQQLSEEERKAFRSELMEQLRWLNEYPRSDWHAAFEAYLMLDACEAEGGTVEVRAEQTLGEDAPRIDFIVWLQDDGTHMNKSIYQIFRRYNIIEYKNPHDDLNWRVIHKAMGYANLYIGLAKNEEERPRNQITLSIFRAVKNPELFKELEKDGRLVPDQTKGIYHVLGLTEFPFQIVIMTELPGEEYATARAMIDDNRASIEDIQRVVETYNAEQDESIKHHIRVMLKLISEKNPEKFDELLRRNSDMVPKWMEIIQPEIDKRDKERDKKNLYKYVQEGGMTIEYAARQVSETVAQFAAEMKQDGFNVPSNVAVGLAEPVEEYQAV